MVQASSPSSFLLPLASSMLGSRAARCLWEVNVQYGPTLSSHQRCCVALHVLRPSTSASTGRGAPGELTLCVVSWWIVTVPVVSCSGASWVNSGVCHRTISGYGRRCYTTYTCLLFMGGRSFGGVYINRLWPLDRPGQTESVSCTGLG
ncbi:uncharacterized protein B0T15DRAFT_146383 [Chaetomium strumarium]|uniref:Uncharacterized protein n=1 Tax=Chaetomium strumarium TaxID=1170767 RepID=A0AAJ0M2K1_9PEZI|nr:hypothetical protein B0T15DRAFT_146383 [Chaetomium strumarium]